MEEWTDAERDKYFAPEGFDDGEYAPPPDDEREFDVSSESDYSLFDAPDYALFIKHKRTERGREYEQKVASMLKAAALTAFKNRDIADGCAILHYGPAFAKKCGDLTDTSQAAARAIDFLTTPDNPWAMFAVVATQFGMQLFRNHEQDAKIAKQTWRQTRAERKRMKAEGLTPPQKREGRPVTIRGPFGKAFTIRVKFPTPAAFARVFRAQTKEPRDLVNQVLEDPKLIRALDKEGIRFVKKHTGGAQ